MKIVADKNIPFLRGVAEAYGEVTYLAGADFSKEAIKDADALIVRTVTHFGKELLEGSTVKLICTATIGYDHIDTDYCDAHGIKWTNAPGCNSGSVEQYIASALVVIAQQNNFLLKGKTIGIVGVGNVGKKVALVCEALGMRVLKNDPPRQEAEGSDEFVSLDTIKKEADIITFHTPLVREGKYATYHLADFAFFGSLAKNPIIINAARGGIIDTSAIKKALIEKQISGAIIDCWEKEPVIDLEYMKLVDIATPHIAGYSADGKGNATRMSLEAIADFWSLSKEPIGKVVIPQVENPVIDWSILNGDKLEQAILMTYNPTEDHKRLVSNPADFSSLRGNYPLRREYLSYTVENVDNAADKAVLQKIGFIIK
ncbi:erythronate-4-phosphate dehydrogenase [Dysgonomonas alginatilytica]|uniref:Erythronate-4-phosphate dehydrogenase n=1 Tax=Dysgonomonas alginatilytica TaxID=1605892 RepID=A0A2V3PMR6_9BACT|nr:4-phosphoerythronate dehydrogenase PdxB [Dysgonomonas alginatilytica]PXV62854.1 erythronate-4-phosphate dehydrogenase [Dysgonomonas alginatilytica]